jgi:cephalosporin hydroxylase
MNDLEKYFYGNENGIIIHKWLHYFDIYERHFSKYRGKKVNILEIGVYHGGSLNMWLDYFGVEATIYGIDINPTCNNLETDNIKIHIGSQEDRNFLRNLKSKLPEIDVLIDDGGHTMKQQITTFEELFSHVKKDGVYLCEDTHTSYWRNYGGGYKKSKSFMEFAKNFIDYIHAWHSEEKRKLEVSEYTKSIKSIHFYDSIVVFEKAEMVAPTHKKMGVPNPLIDESKSC